MGYGYYDGKFGALDELSLPLSDRAVFFGDGVYDAAIGGGGGVYLLEEHIERLLSSARAISLPDVPSKDGLTELIERTVKESGLALYFVYFQLSRARDGRAHSALGASGCHLLITVTKTALPAPARPLRLMRAEDVRYRLCNIKSLNLLPNVLAASRAEEAGCDEAVFVRDGIVTECAHSNIFILKEGVLHTHRADESILAGITRRHLIKKARELGIPVCEEGFSEAALFSADEVIVTSTSKLALAAESVDGVSVGGADPRLLSRLTTPLFEDFYGFLRKKRKI